MDYHIKFTICTVWYLTCLIISRQYSYSYLEKYKTIKLRICAVRKNNTNMLQVCHSKFLCEVRRPRPYLAFEISIRILGYVTDTIWYIGSTPKCRNLTSLGVWIWKLCLRESFILMMLNCLRFNFFLKDQKRASSTLNSKGYLYSVS